MPNFLQSLQLHKSKFAVAISAVSAIAMIAGSLALPSAPNNSQVTYNQDGQKVAAAAGEVELYPGQSTFLNFQYANQNAAEGRDGTNEMLMTVNVGSPYLIDVNTVVDMFDANGDGVMNDPVNSVCPALVNTDPDTIGNLAGQIVYRPYSAKNATACSGESTRGPVDFTGEGQMGWLRVKVTLKPDILTTPRPQSNPARTYRVGDILPMIRLEGTDVTLLTWRASTEELMGQSKVSTDFKIRAPLTNPITLANLGNGTCWEGSPQNTNPIRIGQLSTCAFPISGGTTGAQGGYTIPDDFALRLDNATNSAPGTNCIIRPTAVGATTYFLECTQVPTAGATPGIQPITVTASGQTGPKGTVSLATPVNTDTISSIVCTPNPQIVGTPVDCTVNLTGASPFIPSDFKLKIGTSVPTNCSVTGLITTNSFTCVGIATSGNTIPEGQNEAPFPVFQSTDNFAVPKGTTRLTPIINPIQNSNIDSAACTPSTLYLNGTPATTTCTAQLDSNTLNGTVNFALANMPETCNAPVISGQNTASCTITPTMVSPSAGTPVTASVPGSTNGSPVSAGTLNILSLGRPVATTANPISGVIGSPMPTISLTNANVPANTPVNFTPEGCTTAIPGTITNNVWTPQSGAVIPNCALINSRTGTLSAPNFPSVPVPTNFSPRPTIGTPIATTASPISGKIGNPFPNIPLQNSNVPANTPVTFTPAGCTTPINGTIQNGTWTPQSGATIPDCATLGPDTGTLKSNGLTDVPVPTNFSPRDTLGTVSATPITGIVGITPMPNIPLNGNTLPNGTPVTFTPAGGSPVAGTIQNNSFVPSNGALIPANAIVGPETGILSSSNVPSVNVPTNFTAPTLGTPGPITGVPGQPFTQTIPLTGSNVPNETPATFTPPGCVPPNTIAGTIQNGVFVPSTGQILPTCAQLGPQTTGTLTSPIVPDESPSVPTNFTANTTPIDTPGTDVGDAITSINCIPDPTAVRTTVICSGQLGSPFVQPTAANPLKVRLDNPGATEAVCTFNAPTTFTCAPANVGTETGLKPVLASSGPNPFTPTLETITVNAREITQPDLPNIGGDGDTDPFISFTCANNNTAMVSQDGYTCTGILKPDYILPAAGLKVGVDTTPTGVCLPGSTTGTVNCTNVPVTATPGPTTPLKAQIGDGTPTNTARTINVLPALTLGTADPIGGPKGTPFPSIPLRGTNLPDGTVANFTPEGGTAPIAGEIIPVNGVKTWVPLNNPNIPNTVLTGPKTGILNVPSNPDVAPLTVQTNFTEPAPTIGNVTGGQLTGQVGTPVQGTITLSGNLPNDTPATYSNGTNCSIPGSIQSGAFVPTSGETVDAECPIGTNTAGTVTASNQTAPNAPSNFTPIASSSAPSSSSLSSSPASSSMMSSAPASSSIPASSSMSSSAAPAFGTQPPTGGLTGTIGQPVQGTITYPGATDFPTEPTPATFTNGPCVIQGTIQQTTGGAVFTPTSGQNIPANCPTGSLNNGTITVPSINATSPNNAPSNFTAPASSSVSSSMMPSSMMSSSPISSSATSSLQSILLINSNAGDNKVIFTPNKNTPSVFGDRDLLINTTGLGFTPVTCTIRMKPYESAESAFINLPTTISGDNCGAKLPKEAQTIPKWDYEIRLTAPDGQRWGENGSYFFIYGAIGVVDIIVVRIEESSSSSSQQ